MNIQLAKLKRIAIFLAGISAVSIPAMAYADWSIMGLGSLGGSSGASDINDSGQVVGTSYLADGSSHAFITGPNGVGMDTLDGYGYGSRATDINNSGQVVGTSFETDDSSSAFITGPNGVGIKGLGLMYATGINDSGEAVGYAETTVNREWHSFLYSHGGITDLSLLAPVVAAGWTELRAASINNNGQIVGGGLHNGKTEAFLLSYIPAVPAVPEPETYLMLLGGLGLIGYLARRRKETAI